MRAGGVGASCLMAFVGPCFRPCLRGHPTPCHPRKVFPAPGPSLLATRLPGRRTGLFQESLRDLLSWSGKTGGAVPRTAGCLEEGVEERYEQAPTDLGRGRPLETKESKVMSP